MTVVKTAKIGGSDITVGRVGHGLMMMTWRDPKVPLSDEDAFEAIIAGIEVMPAGVKMMLNSGEFYSHDLGTANLELLSRFYAKYPEYVERTFLSVKGGVSMQGSAPGPDGTMETLRRSVTNINQKLGGLKKMDLFEIARIPNNVPLEETMKNLAQLKDEGHFSFIGLSECSAASLRKAHSLHPIAVVEIEVSLWSYEEETKKVIEATKELGVTVAAYSPLGRGVLTGTIKSPKDLPAGDARHHFTRFQEDVFEHNMALVEAVKGLAEKKGITPGQLSIAWVVSLGDHIVPIPGSSHKKRNLENIAAGDIELTAEESAEIEKVLARTVIKGGRYNDNVDPKAQYLWG